MQLYHNNFRLVGGCKTLYRDILYFSRFLSNLEMGSVMYKPIQPEKYSRGLQVGGMLKE